MADIKVHAGDFSKSIKTIMVSGSSLSLNDPLGGGFLGKTETFTRAQIETIEVASEESVKKVGGTVGWGVVGAAVLGPVGLLAGLLLGGKKNMVTFVVKFSDGRKILATVDNKTYTKMQALIF